MIRCSFVAVVIQSHIFKNFRLQEQYCFRNLGGKKEMLRETLEAKKGNPKVFQVLLLNNDKNQEVEVQNTEQVDFFRVQEHLKQGGSVFITSKCSQKIAPPKAKKRTLENSGLRTVTAVYFENA